MPTSPNRLTYLDIRNRRIAVIHSWVVNDISTLLNTTLLFHLKKILVKEYYIARVVNFGASTMYLLGLL
jgi:hypothetical protein